jgi:UDP-N-acetylglucosamine 4,6-dehydratase
MKITLTGANGFLGKALTKHFTETMNEVKCLGHSEKKTVECMDNGCEWKAGDITDKEFTDTEITGDVVIHAAAQKVIPIAEQNPSFSFKNNILGTLNVFESAIKNGVKAVVFISTDKSYNPETIYGFSKYAGEWLCWYFNKKQTGTRFYACRYGNVIFSALSIFEIWDREARLGNTLKITVPEMSRFFFGIDDAVRTVCETLDAKLEDKPYIPKMKAMVMQDALDIFTEHYGVDFEVIGNRGMEKLHEGMSDEYNSETCEHYTKEEFKELLLKAGCFKI